MSTKKTPATHGSEVRIAITDVSSEVAFECPSPAAEIREAVTAALTSGNPLILNDLKGRQIIVPAQKIGFVEIGEQSERRVGFGTL